MFFLKKEIEILAAGNNMTDGEEYDYIESSHKGLTDNINGFCK